eukprot:5419615-Amphidinium_carterae.1
MRQARKSLARSTRFHWETIPPRLRGVHLATDCASARDTIAPKHLDTMICMNNFPRMHYTVQTSVDAVTSKQCIWKTNFQVLFTRGNNRMCGFRMRGSAKTQQRS